MVSSLKEAMWESRKAIFTVVKSISFAIYTYTLFPTMRSAV